MTPLQMYLLILVTKMPGVGFLMGVLAIALVLTSIMLLAAPAYDGKEEIAFRKWGSRGTKVGATLFVLGILINFFSVDMKQVALIYGVPAVLNNEQAQQLPDNVLKYVNTWLEENTKESSQEEK